MFSVEPGLRAEIFIIPIYLIGADIEVHTAYAAGQTAAKNSPFPVHEGNHVSR